MNLLIIFFLAHGKIVFGEHNNGMEWKSSDGWLSKSDRVFQQLTSHGTQAQFTGLPASIR